MFLWNLPESCRINHDDTGSWHNSVYLFKLFHPRLQNSVYNTTSQEKTVHASFDQMRLIYMACNLQVNTCDENTSQDQNAFTPILPVMSRVFEVNMKHLPDGHNLRLSTSWQNDWNVIRLCRLCFNKRVTHWWIRDFMALILVETSSWEELV